MLRIRKTFRFKHKLMSFDSTTISLALSAFPWAKFRTKKGGVKLHVLLDNADLMPDFVHMTEARMHDSKAFYCVIDKSRRNKAKRIWLK